MQALAVENLHQELFNLPVHERATLAYDLLLSLDESPDQDVSEAWDDEINQRLDQLGESRLLDRETFSRRMRERTPTL